MPGESSGAQAAPEVPVSDLLLRPRKRERGLTPPLTEELRTLLDDLITPTDLRAVLVLANLHDILNELANYLEGTIEKVSERKPPAEVVEKLEETVRALREAANAAYNARQTYVSWLTDTQRITMHIAKKLEEMIAERLGV